MSTVGAIGGALDDLEEARLFQGPGSCTLSVNRRRPLADDPMKVTDIEDLITANVHELSEAQES